MYLHEYQAKKIFSEFGIPVMPHAVISSIEELQQYVEVYKPTEAVLKIQVHAGGRGRAGGIIHAKSWQEILDAGKKLLGMKLVNNQTGPSGVVVEKILIDTPVAFSKEYYLAVVLDRKACAATVIASQEGGMAIEELAKMHPEKIVREHIGDRALTDTQLSKLVQLLGWQQCEQQGIAILNAAVRAFFELDALLVEINPLVLTASGFLIALDAKVQIDDNALFRQPHIQAMFDPGQLSYEERVAQQHDLAYVAMPGDIGCIVNGAGLAMATMDLIHYWGGEPANFLDVGGGASKEKVVEGFNILFHDPKVKAILVNIFGGIMNCEIIAEALLEAINNKKIPVVVRMEGTNVEAARARLLDAKIYSVTSLDEAAKRVVEL